MAISPNQEYQLAVEIRRIYEDAEFRLLRMMAEKLYSGGDIAEWQIAKLNQLTPILQQARRETNKLDKQIPKLIEQIINLAYLSGAESAVADLKAALETINNDELDLADHPEIARVAVFNPETAKINVDATMATFGGVNTGAVEALAAATVGVVGETHAPILRSVNDKYRQIIAEVAGSPLTGVDTRKQATQRALDRFISDGITVFRDSKGRNRDIASYAETAVRTAIGQASMQGHMDQMTEMGFDLVQVSDHKEECDLCRPWEGKILSKSGHDPEYPSLSEATASGLFHPNCGHRLQTYFPGISTKLEKTEDPAGNEERQRQRYLERGIRKWKKRQATAVSVSAQQLADRKVELWQEEMRKFIDETDRYRKYEREQIKRAR